MKRIEIGIVDPAAEQAALLAWAKNVDGGRPVGAATPQLNFATFMKLHATLTEKRMALLRHVAEHERLNIRQLAQARGRDYKNVHDDVSRLCELGLREKLGGGLVAPYDEIVMHYSVRQAA